MHLACSDINVAPSYNLHVLRWSKETTIFSYQQEMPLYIRPATRFLIQVDNLPVSDVDSRKDNCPYDLSAAF